MDHVLRYQDTPGIKMIVVLGEVGVVLRMFIASDVVFRLNLYVFNENNLWTKPFLISPLSLTLSSTQIGGTEEYKICQGIREGRITKPVVCWCIGTCATMFASEVCWKELALDFVVRLRIQSF